MGLLAYHEISHCLWTGQYVIVVNSRQREITFPSQNCVVFSLKVKLFPFPVKPDNLCSMRFLCGMEMLH